MSSRGSRQGKGPGPGVGRGVVRSGHSLQDLMLRRAKIDKLIQKTSSGHQKILKHLQSLVLAFESSSFHLIEAPMEVGPVQRDLGPTLVSLLVVQGGFSGSSSTS